MSSTLVRHRFVVSHPVYAILVGALPLLFGGALLSDLAYRATFHMQWANFASWLIAGALLVGGLVLLWALIELLRSGRARRMRQGLHVLALLVMWVLGLFNALVHAKDAWAIMPEGLYLSGLTTLVALIAAWMAFSRIEQIEVA